MARRKRGNPVHGWVVLNKPLDLNSTTAVSIIRRLFNAQKAGHAGTLDPLATGILPIALGEATKTVPFIMDSLKTYRFTVRWGNETNTDDLEGEVTSTSLKRPSWQEIKDILQDFTGPILQTPPAFSAIKINGERAYDLARAGKEVDLTPRPVTIERLEMINSPNEEETEFQATCSKGTYIRVLGRDMGRELGCLGHISKLHRTSTGPFNEEMSISLEKLKELSHSALADQALPQTLDVCQPSLQKKSQALAPELRQHLHPIETALDDIPALAISEAQAAQLKLGQSILLTQKDIPITSGPAYTMQSEKAVAIGQVAKGTFKPKRVFNL